MTFLAQRLTALSPGRRVALALLVVCLGALGGALVLEHAFGVAPCVLCLWQRVPYAVVAVLAAFALVPALPLPVRRAVIAICGVAFLVNLGIAAYHVGVEQHWWAGTAACTAPAGGAPQSLAEMRAALDNPQPLARCDEVAWSLFGISLPGYNVALSLVLGVATLWVAARPSMWKTPVT